MCFLNLNHKFNAQVEEICRYYIELKSIEGINLGEVQFQIRDEDYNVAVKFSNGYKLVIIDDKVDDFARGFITTEEALLGSSLINIS